MSPSQWKFPYFGHHSLGCKRFDDTTNLSSHFFLSYGFSSNSYTTLLFSIKKNLLPPQPPPQVTKNMFCILIFSYIHISFSHFSFCLIISLEQKTCFISLNYRRRKKSGIQAGFWGWGCAQRERQTTNGCFSQHNCLSKQVK